MFGGIASSLERGIECPDYATYFDAMVVTESGRPRERKRAACLFERSAGDVAWRHGRERGDVIETREKRDLVLRMYMTAGNYDTSVIANEMYSQLKIFENGRSAAFELPGDPERHADGAECDQQKHHSHGQELGGERGACPHAGQCKGAPCDPGHSARSRRASRLPMFHGR